MLPTPALPTTNTSVYLDTCFLLDLAIATRTRNALAEQALTLFAKYKTHNQLSVLMSAWTLSEAHGILYEDDLTSRGFATPPYCKGRIRNLLPPDASGLGNAWGPLIAATERIKRETAFQFLDTGEGDFWILANDLATEGAIWPPDSVHVAFALQEGCAFFLSDDKDLLDKVECASSYIATDRNTRFSLATVPPFAAHGLTPLPSNIPGRASPQRMTIFDALANLGFVL